MMGQEEGRQCLMNSVSFLEMGIRALRYYVVGEGQEGKGGQGMARIKSKENGRLGKQSREIEGAPKPGKAQKGRVRVVISVIK